VKLSSSELVLLSLAQSLSAPPPPLVSAQLDGSDWGVESGVVQLP
jgi:hypothetical protein